MLEVLQIIVLACQVNTGFRASNAHEEIDTFQKQCQQKLIKCFDKEQEKIFAKELAIKACLLKR